MRTDLLYYKKSGSLSTILNTVHQEMKKYLTLNDQSVQAQQIESILREIKMTVLKMSKKTNSQIINEANSQIQQLIIDTFNEQLQTHSSLKNIHSLFYRSHTKSSKLTPGADDIFEEQLAYLLKAAADKSGQNDSITIDMILGGQNAGFTSALNNIDDIISKKVAKVTVLAAENYKKSAEQAARLGGIAQVRAGKVDIKAPNFIVEANADDLISRLLRVFSGRTFSLKNYSSFKQVENDIVINKTTNEINIHFGDSNMYKGITGSLSSIFSDVQIQNTIYFRGMNYLRKITNPPDSSSEDLVQKHFAHLRFIYEIRGQGLVDQNGNSQIADFIIWNDPNSPNIAVRSTKWLINKASQKYTNPFQPVSLSASYFT